MSQSENKPQIQEPAPSPAASQIPMDVSGEQKKKIRSRTVWDVADLYVDRPVDQGGFGSFAADGREFLDVDASVFKSLIRHYSSGNGQVWPSIMPMKVTICGSNEKPMLVVLNGRQRLKAVDRINRVMARIHKMWHELDKDKVRLKNAVVTMSEQARNGAATQPWLEDFAMLDGEDVDHLVGGRVNGESVPGLLTKSRETEDGPMPYCVRVEYSDIDPNTPEALELSTAERISVPTPPLVVAHQIRRLLDANRTPDSIAANFGVSTRTLFNQMLILLVEPEVQQAVNSGKIKWRTLKDSFFVDTKTRGPVVKSRKEQMELLERYAGVPVREAAAMRTDLAKAEGKVPSPTAATLAEDAAKRATQPTATAVPPGTAPTGAPPAAAAKPVRGGRKDDTSILALLPRAAAMVRRQAEELPVPDMEAGAEEFWKAKEEAVRFDTASRVVAFLGGDSTALDDMADLQKVISDSLATARADAEAEEKKAVERELEAKGMTPKQKLATSVMNLFEDWEDQDVDERTDWPQTTWCRADPEVRGAQPAADAEIQEVVGKIQAEYIRRQKEGDAEFKSEYEANYYDFANYWVLSNLLGLSITIKK